MSTLLSLNKKKEGNNMKVKVIDVQLTTDENTITLEKQNNEAKTSTILVRNIRWKIDMFTRRYVELHFFKLHVAIKICETLYKKQ